MVYATGRLRPERRDRIELSREARERHGVSLPESAVGRVIETDAYAPFFVGGAEGFDVPMMDGEQIAGVLSVEYPKNAAPPDDDRALIVQLALQLGSALRNSRLHRESVYLRDYLSKLLDHANAPIMVMGRDGEITFANRAFLTLTGFRRDDILGKDWLSSMPEAERRRRVRAGVGARLRRSAPGRRLPCDARSCGLPQNSLRSLRSLRSDSCGKFDDEARCARGHEACASRRRRHAPPPARTRLR